MRIGFIGAGRVGFSLGKYLVNNGYTVSGYFNRNPLAAMEAAKFTDTKSYNNIEELLRDSEVIFITVSDGAIAAVWDELQAYNISGRIFCHCSGVLSSSVFSNKADCYGYSIHPFLAVNDRQESYKELSKALFTIEGPEYHRDILADIFIKCGNRVVFLDKENKAKYHLAAVFASNLMCGLMENAISILSECGFTKDEAKAALVPLAFNNISHLMGNNIEEVLTGPVERGDTTTVAKHLHAMGDNKEDKMLYTLLSKRALDIAKRKNPKRDYTKLEDMLNG